MKQDDELVEALLFAAGDPVNIEDLCEWAGVTQQDMDVILSRLGDGGRGVIARRFGNNVQLVTNPKYSDILHEIFATEQERRLSASLVETLTIIAYRQPVTRLEIEELRGVRCSYSIAALCERGLVERVGTRDILGHPAEYGTTDEFLRQFDLRSLNDLPSVDGLRDVHLALGT